MRDPILFEIVKNAINTISEEMHLTVIRSAYSTLVKEGGDVTTAIFDAQGQLVAQAMESSLMHVSSLRVSLAEIMKDFPPETMREGDAYLCNDPFRGGIHSNDCMVFKPIFWQGRLAFFSTVLTHVSDLGGISAGGLPANATEIFHEGLVIPPVKFYDRGEPQETVTKIIASNSRTPEMTLGDLRALLAGTNVGATRVASLIARYGLEDTQELTRELLDYTERRVRQGLEKVTPGTYEGSFTIDDDGVDLSKSHTVRARVTIAGPSDGSSDTPSFHVDFQGTDKQARGPINASISQTMSAVLFVMGCLIDPTIPMNEGRYRPLSANLPYGTLVNPKRPAACNVRLATVGAICEAMFSALSRAFPAMAIAASGNIHVFTMTGAYPQGGRTWAFMDPSMGGVGARSGKDGVDVAGAYTGGGGSVWSIEGYETEYPVLYQRVGLWQDSGGPGRYRGGAGLRREIKILDHGSTTVRATDRTRFPPPGVFGGEKGRAGGWVLNMDTPKESRLPSKASNIPLSPGDTLTMLTSGGGGFGPAWERDPQMVLSDVLDGRVSIEGALRDYGVVIDPQTLAVDAEQTWLRRAAMVTKPPTPSPRVPEVGEGWGEVRPAPQGTR